MAHEVSRGGLKVRPQRGNRATVLNRLPRTRKALALFLLTLLAAEPGSAQVAQDAETQVVGPHDFRQIVVRAKDRVFPAVVFIRCVQETHEEGEKRSRQVSGSGVIISADGEVVTNWHVVDKATEVRCLLYDGRRFHATVVGSDKDTDLALLRLKLPADAAPVAYASLGDSRLLEEGDWVLAMGAPWGMSRSVSVGIISCTRRFLPHASEYSLWLQTDAAISPGNSGGPLVNTDGEVIGINSRGIMAGGDMGFAVPSNTVRSIVDQLRIQGKVNWSWTGLQLQPLKDFDRNMYFDATEGVVVSGTDRESPARRAGLLAKDRIVRINSQPVTAMTTEDLPAIRRRLGLLPKNKPAVLKIMRGDEEMNVELIPREKGRVEGEELNCPRWDLTVKTINQFDNPELFFYRKEGVYVYGIKMPGNANNTDVFHNDIILTIDEQKVSTLEDLKSIHEASLTNVKRKHRLLFTVLRNGAMRRFVLDIARDYEKD